MDTQMEEQSSLQKLYEAFRCYHELSEKIYDIINDNSEFICCIHMHYYPKIRITIWKEGDDHEQSAKIEFINDIFKVVETSIYSENEIKNIFKPLLDGGNVSLMKKLHQYMDDIRQCEKEVIEKLEEEDFIAVVHLHGYPKIIITLWKRNELNNFAGNAEVWFDERCMAKVILSGQYREKEILQQINRIL